ncbi:hypothetical protein GCM10009798_23300 [Nocardioides panacihumi]|uniref:Toprim domain-containing protein n=1 Tax=Nocardioides panacihumi TaxID=400774 RepID=A0ABN2R3M0_9ACTN
MTDPDFEAWDAAQAEMTAHERVVEALERGGSRADEGRPDFWNCPAHEDRNPSLHVEDAPDRVLLHCFAGCSQEAVAGALGIGLGQLFNERATYTYTDADGTPVKSVKRLPGKKFVQTGDTAAVLLYRLPAVLRAVAEGRTVWLVEGEKDVHSLEVAGEVATTCSGGANAWHKVDVSPLYGAHVVAVLDADEAGQKWANQVLDTLDGQAASLTFRQAAHGKDVTDHLLVAGTDTLVEVTPAERTPHDLAVAGEVRRLRAQQEARAALAVEEARAGRLGGTGWSPVDLRDVLVGLRDGTIDRPAPTLGDFGDGCLFYAGRINGVHGDSTAGKTWTALVTAAQEIAKGETVVYVDLEDSAEGALARLVLDLGVEPDDVAKRLVYLRPDEPLTLVSTAALRALLAERRPSLVVVDSTGEALAQAGANPNADDEVARWFRTLPLLAVEAGAAVLLLDHATKAGDKELWPIGSQRKRAAITGAAYLQKVAAPFGRDQDGRAVLVCAKDRHGNYPLGHRVAALRVQGGVISLAPEGTAAADFGDKTNADKERVSRALEAAGRPLSGSAVETAAGGNKARVQAALAALVKDGCVTVATGERNAKMHTLVRPFHADGLLL